MSLNASTEFDDDADDILMSEINMTPLVDVMLVLLVIFLVTLPVIHHAVQIDVPRASSRPLADQPTQIDLAIAGDGSLQWNGTALARADLAPRIAQAAAQATPPLLRLSADRHVQYQYVAEVMAAAQAGGLNRIGFVTAPPAAR
jgi:biopolymer transport protein ExbD